MTFEDQVLDRMRRLRFTVDHYDTEAIFDQVDRYLPLDITVDGMDQRTFVSIVDRNVW